MSEINILKLKAVANKLLSYFSMFELNDEYTYKAYLIQLEDIYKISYFKDYDKLKAYLIKKIIEFDNEEFYNNLSNYSDDTQEFIKRIINNFKEQQELLNVKHYENFNSLPIKKQAIDSFDTLINSLYDISFI